MDNNIVASTYAPNTNIYRYTATITFTINDEVYKLPVLNIKSIAIDYDYIGSNMPMILLTLSIDRRLLDKVIQYQNTSTAIFELKRCIINSDMPDLFENYISDKFVYFIDEGINKKDKMDYQGPNEGREDLFSEIPVGLLSLDHVNKNKIDVNGIMSGKLSSMMYYLTKHLSILMEPPENNVIMKELVLPPINSVSKALEYLNSVNVFYSTKYRFFIDFDCSYLISSSGKVVEKQGEDINTIFIEILDISEIEAALQGMTVDEEQSMYRFQVPSGDCEITDSCISEKNYTKISATMTSGDRIEGEISNKPSGSIINMKTRTIRIPNKNTGLLDNFVSSVDRSSIQLFVQKVDIDSSVLTINKEYIIKADSAYKSEEYNGKYILIKKKELYMKKDDTFVLGVILFLEKID